ncbi:MAG: hypothetical protein R3D81_07450 [Thalassovita sp.]
MNKQQFEQLLQDASDILTTEARQSSEYHKPSAFEKRVRFVLSELLEGTGHEAAPDIDQGFQTLLSANSVLK